MSNLDEKLKALNIDNGYGMICSLDDDAVAEIKQAFIDAGWMSQETAENSVITHTFRDASINALDKYFAAGGDTDFVIMSQTDWERNVMTGQEWYDKFEESMPRIAMNGVPLTSFETKVLNAAKKAAGIE